MEICLMVKIVENLTDLHIFVNHFIFNDLIYEKLKLYLFF